MAQPSSSHHEERRHRSDRERSSSHHHHRTISSTTLLLVLSLVLAVLAVMLSLPSGTSPTTGTDSTSPGGVMSYLTPKRTQALIARESAVAVREAEVARREAELLAGAPGGVVPAPAAPVICPTCPSPTTITEILPAQTIIKEIVKDDSLAAPGWVGPRAEELLDRELKIAERERDISRREEGVNRREHDAARRENWIMEQLVALGNAEPSVEDEYIYEQPKHARKPKMYKELPPLIPEVSYETQTKIVVQTQTVTVPPPANTRLAPNPTPEAASHTTGTGGPRTTAIEYVTEEDGDHNARTMLRQKRLPTRWFGDW